MALKRAKTNKNSEKKLQIFLCVSAFTQEEKKFYNKNCLFNAKFFEFGVKS